MAIDSLESNAIVLKLPNSWSADTLRDHAALLEAAIADVLGVPLKIVLRVGSAQAAPAAASQERSRRAVRLRERTLSDNAEDRYRTMNQAQLLAQMKKMQAEMARAQEELANTIVTR